jgi:hypothetical protein
LFVCEANTLFSLRAMDPTGRRQGHIYLLRGQGVPSLHASLGCNQSLGLWARIIYFRDRRKSSLFGSVKIIYVFLSTAIRRSPLFSGHSGDPPDPIFFNFLDLQAVTHIILIHDMRLSSVTVTVKGPLGNLIMRLPRNRLLRGWWKMSICKAPEVPRNAAYVEVRRND